MWKGIKILHLPFQPGQIPQKFLDCPLPGEGPTGGKFHCQILQGSAALAPPWSPEAGRLRGRGKEARGATVLFSGSVTETRAGPDLHGFPKKWGMLPSTVCALKPPKLALCVSPHQRLVGCKGSVSFANVTVTSGVPRPCLIAETVGTALAGSQGPEK